MTAMAEGAAGTDSTDGEIDLIVADYFDMLRLERAGQAFVKPGELTYGSVGEASLANLSTLLLSNAVGIELTHVPYKSAGAAALDVISGRIDMQFSTLSATLPFIESGQLRAMAVATAERVPELPDVPTIAEQGVEGYESSLWFGFVAPAGLPENVQTELNSNINEILKNPDTIEKLAQQGVTPRPTTPADFGNLIENDIAKWTEVAKAAGITTISPRHRCPWFYDREHSMSVVKLGRRIADVQQHVLFVRIHNCTIGLRSPSCGARSPLERQFQEAATGL